MSTGCNLIALRVAYCRVYYRVVLIPALCSLALLAACGGMRAAQRGPIALSAVPVSHGKSGAIRSTIALSDADWAAVTAMFVPPARSPHEERVRVAAAVAEFERLAGAQLPTRGDLQRNTGTTVPSGATDCIDESTNTTTYCVMLQQHGLLRWHRVNNPATRLLHGLEVHSTCVIEEVTPPGEQTAGPGVHPGSRWAVDSWYGDHAQPPMIMPLDDWFAERTTPLDDRVVKPEDSQRVR